LFINKRTRGLTAEIFKAHSCVTAVALRDELGATVKEKVPQKSEQVT